MARGCEEITLSGDTLDRMRPSDFLELAELQNRIALVRVALEGATDAWSRASQRAAVAAGDCNLTFETQQTRRREAQRAAAALEDARMDLTKLVLQRWALLRVFSAAATPLSASPAEMVEAD